MCSGFDIFFLSLEQLELRKHNLDPGSSTELWLPVSVKAHFCFLFLLIVEC